MITAGEAAQVGIKVAVFVVVKLRFRIVALAGVLVGIALGAPVGGGIIGREPGIIITLAGKDGCLAVSIVLITFHERSCFVRQAVNVIERISMGEMPVRSAAIVQIRYRYTTRPVIYRPDLVEIISVNLIPQLVVVFVGFRQDPLYIVNLFNRQRTSK